MQERGQIARGPEASGGDEQWSATTCMKFGKWGWFVLFSLPTNLSSLNLMNETWQVVGVKTWIKIM